MSASTCRTTNQQQIETLEFEPIGPPREGTKPTLAASVSQFEYLSC